MQVKVAESHPKKVLVVRDDTLLNPWKSWCRCVGVKEEIILISASAVNVSQVNKYQLGKFPQSSNFTHF